MPATRCRFSLVLCLVVAVLLPSGFALTARAESGFELTPDLLQSTDAAPLAFHLDLESTGLWTADGARSRSFGLAGLQGSAGTPSPTTLGVPPAREIGEVSVAPRKDRKWLILGGFTTMFLGLEYVAFWASAEKNSSFQFYDEGWFGPHTAYGGADKAAHLLGGYIAGRIAEAGLRRTGMPASEAQLMSTALITLTGALVEVGDAYHGYGFCWQDAVITAAGGAVGSLLSRSGWDDTVTMRFGMVGADEPADPSLVIAPPNHYSGEIYSADLRFAGLFPRLQKDPGLARYFLLSLTYGSKGYEWVDESIRQRLLGFEIGLDLHQVALALGVPPDTWWGAPILAFLKYFRLPFTGIGFQYELNSSRWKGPNSFYRFDF